MQKQNKTHSAKRSIIWAAIFGASFSMISSAISQPQPNQSQAGQSKSAQQVSVMVSAQDKPDAANTSGTSGVAAKQPAQSQATQAQSEALPILNMPAAQSNNDLAEYSRLYAEKRKLELMKDIAKLKKEREDIENGPKAEKQTEKDSLIQMLQMQLSSKQNQPTPAQILYDSVTVLAVFGSGNDMMAKIYTDSGIITAEIGSKIPSGEVVQNIKDGAVFLVKGKLSRKLTPTSEKPIAPNDRMPMPNSQQGQGFQSPPPILNTAQGAGTSPFSGPPPQYIAPFDANDVMGKPATVKLGGSGTSSGL